MKMRMAEEDTSKINEPGTQEQRGNEGKSAEPEKSGDVKSDREEQTSRQTRDPLTYILWGGFMICYGGYVFITRMMQSRGGEALDFVMVTSVFIFLVGIFSIIYGLKRFKKVKVIALKRG